MLKFLIFCIIYAVVSALQKRNCTLPDRFISTRDGQLQDAFRISFAHYADPEDFYRFSVSCRYLYGSPLTNEENAPESNKPLNPKHVYWSPADKNCKNQANHFYNHSFWLFHRVPELDDDVYEIENILQYGENIQRDGQFLTVKGWDRGVDPEKYVLDGGRLLFLENHNTSSDVKDIASFWRICTYDWLRIFYSFQNFATGEYLYLG